MKALPILVITNALALGLAILLFVRHDELATKVQSARNPGSRAAPSASEDTTALQERIEALERQLREVARGRALPVDSAAGARVSAPPADAAAAMPTADSGAPAAAGDVPAVDLPAAEMDVFRQHVRKAIEMNGEEDRVRRVEDSLDALVLENKIAPLSGKQKTRIANVILGYRERMPQIWQQMREMPDGVSREERGQVIRQAFETMRTDAQKEMEEVVPAIDAKVILEAQVREMPAMFGGGGPGGMRRGGDGGGARGR